MSSTECVWGICGCGGISNDFALALAHNKSKIGAVAASDVTRAQKFADDFGAKKAYGSYEEMAADPEITIVYIGTVHTQHLGHASMFLKAGKHLLCEKPMGINEKEVQTLVDLAKQNNVFLMEGFWTRCFPVVKQVREVIASGELGALRAVSADFGFVAPSDPNHRLWTKSTAGGGMLDIGCYVVQAATMGFGYDEVPQIKATGAVVGEGVDKNCSMSLAFKGGNASLSYGLDAHYLEETKFFFEKGYIVIEEPAHCPTKARVIKCETRTDTTTKHLADTLPEYQPGICGGRKVNYPSSEGLVHEVEEVERCIREGLKESPVFPLAESLMVARIMDSVRREIGVVYDADSA
eukprot:TRINITY_DN123014_c0_g1_i1.p1 TRINITY_DN123014_c0_g1~~TRINITY_DN123014_c0_g1_i1.p1  ORF type:complete len:351 (+),score=88.91 TRINITY_DN123014_c0_g1_i1:110-1162(+)